MHTLASETLDLLHKAQKMKTIEYGGAFLGAVKGIPLTISRTSWKNKKQHTYPPALTGNQWCALFCLPHSHEVGQAINRALLRSSRSTRWTTACTTAVGVLNSFAFSQERLFCSLSVSWRRRCGTRCTARSEGRGAALSAGRCGAWWTFTPRRARQTGDFATRPVCPCRVDETIFSSLLPSFCVFYPAAVLNLSPSGVLDVNGIRWRRFMYPFTLCLCWQGNRSPNFTYGTHVVSPMWLWSPRGNLVWSPFLFFLPVLFFAVAPYRNARHSGPGACPPGERVCDIKRGTSGKKRQSG